MSGKKTVSKVSPSKTGPKTSTIKASPTKSAVVARAPSSDSISEVTVKSKSSIEDDLTLKKQSIKSSIPSTHAHSVSSKQKSDSSRSPQKSKVSVGPSKKLESDSSEGEEAAPIDVRPYELIECFADYSQSYRIMKNTLNLENTRLLSKELCENFNLIALYGDEDYCRIALGTYFNSQLIKKLDVSEGVAMYYCARNQRAALHYKSNDQDLFKDRPVSHSHRSITVVRILSDISPLVICFLSSQDISCWSSQSPFAPKRHKAVDIRIETEIIEQSRLEELQEIAFQREETDQIFTTLDTYKNILLCRIIDAQMDQINKKKVLESFNKFLKEVLSNGYNAKNTFNKDFLNLSKVIEQNTGNIRIDTNLVQERLLEKFRQHSAEIKDVIKIFFEKVSNSMHDSISKVSRENPYLGEIQLDSFLKPFESDFLALDCLESSSVSKVTKKFFSSNKYFEKIKKDVTNSIESSIDEHRSQIKNIKSAIEHDMWGVINEFIDSLNGNQLIIKVKSPDFKISSEIRQCRLELSESRNLASIRLRSPNLDFCQAIKLSEKALYILLTNRSLSCTHVFKINPMHDLREEVESLEDFDDTDMMIAWGSTANKFFIVFNTKGQLVAGTAFRGTHINRGNVFLKFSSEIQRIESISYMEKNRKIIFLNQRGVLYCMDTVSKDCLPYVLYKPTLPMAEAPPTEARKEIISSLDGSPYVDLQVSLDEKIFAVRSQRFIECYDQNNSIMHSIPLEEKPLGFKLFTEEIHTFVLVIYPDRSKVWGFSVSQEKSRKHYGRSDNELAPGNPTVDIWHLGLKKFGRVSEVTALREGASKIAVCGIDGVKDPKIDNYVKSLKSITGNFEYCGISGINDTEIYRNPVSRETFINVLLSRIPIHLASIQNGNLIPLQNGVNNFDDFTRKIEKRGNFLVECVEYIKLGHLEEILPRLSNIRVVSIIGRQSSGKSYLLNRLFGTRYDVAAQRCTEGLWMSLAFVENCPFVIFDCEGLFSSERTLQEEMKLCLFLAALSDVLILNSDLTSSRSIEKLFDQFALGVDRLKGANLFKGILEIALRDIGSGQGTDAEEEAETFLDHQRSDPARRSTLKKLFDERYSIIPYHNFENPIFEEEVIDQSKKYLQIRPRFEQGEELLLIIKTALTQIFSDDESSIDERTFEILLVNLKKLLKLVIHDSLLAKQHLQDIPFNCPFKIKENVYQIKINIVDFQLNKALPLEGFLSCVKRVTSEQIFNESFNVAFKELDILIKLFFAARKEALLNFYESKFPKNPAFAKSIELAKLQASQKIDKFASKFYICLKKCNECEYLCTRIANHVEDCSCLTNHKCIFKCEICTDKPQPCDFIAGHKDRHVCIAKKHTCKNQCSVDGCAQQCVLAPNHQLQCMCSKSVHECGIPCKMHSVCKDKCRKDVLIPHSDHDCGQTRCPYKCIFGDGPCLSSDHFHELSATAKVTHPKTGGSCFPHLCGNSHICENLCNTPGICTVQLNHTLKTYNNSYNEVIYKYVEQIPIKNQCSISIPPGALAHAGSHFCNKATEHKCENKCPDCSGFCNRQMGHSGLHKSSTHRNKDQCIYISTDKNSIKREIDRDEDESTICMFKPGESTQPEHCDTCCRRNGRGHTHPVLCPGRENCLQTAHVGYAIHSKDRYYNGSLLDRREYDLVECTTYWRLSGWEAPVFSINPTAQEGLGKCNFFCAHESHPKESVFCEDKIFHSFKEERNAHNFSQCTHSEFIHHDVVFIVDITGSMGAYINATKKTIQKIIEKWNFADTRFAVVAYTDHAPDQGKFITGPIPAVWYPVHKDMARSTVNEAINFLNTLKAGGGGRKYGEAMVDGMQEASKLRFRDGSRPIFIIVADDCPHGREFADRTTYPDGCPCGTSWKNIIYRMKAMKAKIIFVKLSAILNTTFRLFNEAFGGKIIDSTLEGVELFDIRVTDKISRIIKTDLEFSRGSVAL